jgi:hypothetical protein
MKELGGQAATCDKVVNDKEGIGGIRRIRSQNVYTFGGYSPWYGTNRNRYTLSKVAFFWLDTNPQCNYNVIT